MNTHNDYYNFAIRYLETTNQIIRQMDTVNRNLYYIMNRNRTQPLTSTRRNFVRNTNTIPSNNWETTYNNTTTTTTPVLNNLAAQLLNPTFWDTVVVYPTQQEINEATSRVTLAELPPGTINCPITMEQFTSNSEILRINHCGHVFTKDSILRWFRNHVSCPVCRYDIRQLNNNNTSVPESSNDNDSNEASETTAAAAADTAPDTAADTAAPDTRATQLNNTEVIQFDFTVGGGSDILNNVMSGLGLSNMTVNNDLNLMTPQVIRSGTRRTVNSNANSNANSNSNSNANSNNNTRNYNQNRYQ